MFVIFLKACLIGIAIAAPVGPIGVLCIRKTLEMGLWAGLSVGLGAALADGFYGLVAGLGLSGISTFFLNHLSTIHFLGGTFLIYLGIKELRDRNTPVSPLEIQARKALPIITTTFLLTLSNPMTILFFIGVFSTLGDTSFSAFEAVLMTLGVFSGSMLWSLFLSTMVHKGKKFLPEKTSLVTRIISALILFAFGVYALIQGVI